VISSTQDFIDGIPGGFQLSATPKTSPCTWTVTSSPALPVSVTTAHGGKNNCSEVIDGVWTPAATYTVTAKAVGASTKTFKVTVSVTAPPAENAAIGVGSDTLQNVFDQFSVDYNPTVAATATHLYGWDATNPATGAMGDPITTKSTCLAIARPDGSSQGVPALSVFTKTADGKFFCINYATSARDRIPPDPPPGPGGVQFVHLAQDAVSYATQATTNAPANLTTAQLAQIYQCVDTNWAQVGGKNAPIQAFLPQSGAGIRVRFLAAIGVSTPGSCVSFGGGTLQQNEGVNAALKSPDAIVPYSVAKYIAERFHSDTCLNAACTPVSGVVCIHTPGKNLFGCDTHGTMVLGPINGTPPTVGSGKGTTINTGFSPAFLGFVYEVVPFDPATSDHIPGSEAGAPGGVALEPLFGAAGYACANATAKNDLRAYGFLLTSLCGT
jgi:ABC-type phosphate transport system substrate-binding protein